MEKDLFNHYTNTDSLAVKAADFDSVNKAMVAFKQHTNFSVLYLEGKGVKWKFQNTKFGAHLNIKVVVKCENLLQTEK